MFDEVWTVSCSCVNKQLLTWMTFTHDCIFDVGGCGDGAAKNDMIIPLLKLSCAIARRTHELEPPWTCCARAFHPDGSH